MNEQNDITLTISQQKVLDKLIKFIFESDNRVFILKGYAGTGKTTLMRFLIEKLKEEDQMFKLLSTTGRAAKILKDRTGSDATTIHSMIYKYKSFNQEVSDFEEEKTTPNISGQLFLVFEPEPLKDDVDRKSCVYIVDESSMISDIEAKDIVQAKFGSGRTLKELLDYDSKKESKFIFVGDPCQLPPIEGYFSPALEKEYITKEFGMKVEEDTLTEIMRQDNSIIQAGAYVRKLWKNAPVEESYYSYSTWGQPLFVSRYADFQLHMNNEEMEQCYIESVKKNGYAKAVFICNSNRQCLQNAIKLRKKFGFEGPLQKGELLMVTQNQQTTGLMNGDMVEVIDVQSDAECIERQVKGGYSTLLRFREVTVKELFTDRVITTLLLDNVLHSTQNNLDPLQQTGLFLDFILRMKRKGITPRKNKKLFDDLMINDPYLNALRCSYGYAITCHKSQGGEWDEVFILPQRNITKNPTKMKYQWFYTAITRAKFKVHLCEDFFIC